MTGSEMGFNLNDYQTVAERLDEALKEHGDMRVITSLEHTERIDGRPLQYVMKAEIWLGTVLVSTGWAEEIVGNSHVNKTSALENCETSAIGRALANFGFQGKSPAATRPTRNEMEKVERVKKAEREQVKQANPLEWGEPDAPPPPPDDPFAEWTPMSTEQLQESLGAEVIDINKPLRKYFGQNVGTKITEKQENFIRRLFDEKYPDGDLKQYVLDVTGLEVEKLSDLPKLAGSSLIESLKG
jgi:hypothetical protein